jgi:hypothetical protein
MSVIAELWKDVTIDRRDDFLVRVDRLIYN